MDTGKQTGISDLFWEEAKENFVQKGRIIPHPNEFLEIWNFKGCDHSIIKEGNLPDDRLDDWLYQKGVHQVPKGRAEHEVVGGIRLIVQKWSLSTNIPVKRRLTFTPANLQKIIDKLCLPRTFHHDFASTAYVPARVVRIPTANGYHIGFVCQSPSFYHNFMTLALSYNPETNVSSGFLGFVVNDAGISPRDPLLSKLKAASVQVTHPLLLPAIALGTWCHLLRSDQAKVDFEVHEIQRKTGLLNHQYGDSETQHNMDEYHKVHKSLVTQHVNLSTDSANFVDALGIAIQAAFADMSSLKPRFQQEIAKHERELQAFVVHMQDMTRVQKQQRDRMLGRIDIQLKVLYNLIQQIDNGLSRSIALNSVQIAKASKRDSTAMKSIAALTMVFLPGTATATIISMTPFFLSSTESSVVVSSQFWIYWAVTAPLTIVVVTSWLLWLNRDCFLRRPKNHEVDRDAASMVLCERRSRNRMRPVDLVGQQQSFEAISTSQHMKYGVQAEAFGARIAGSPQFSIPVPVITRGTELEAVLAVASAYSGYTVIILRLSTAPPNALGRVKKSRPKKRRAQKSKRQDGTRAPALAPAPPSAGHTRIPTNLASQAADKLTDIAPTESSFL